MRTGAAFCVDSLALINWHYRLMSPVTVFGSQIHFNVAGA